MSLLYTFLMQGYGWSGVEDKEDVEDDGEESVEDEDDEDVEDEEGIKNGDGEDAGVGFGVGLSLKSG